VLFTFRGYSYIVLLNLYACIRRCGTDNPHQTCSVFFSLSGYISRAETDTFIGKEVIDQPALLGNPTLNLWRCKICNHGFATQSLVRRHMSIHTGAKPYKCDVCGNSFSRKDNLKMHRATVHRTMK